MERTKKETSENKVALITERDAHLMIEDNMRRWTATISHSHAVTNNPQLEPYDSGNPRSYIAYLVAKNLYGTTLSEPLTTGNFRFICEHEISDFDVIIVQADGCGLSYPEHLPTRLREWQPNT